ncbi:hypothetical protein Tco_1564248 [Tanacetum coccineum]
MTRSTIRRLTELLDEPEREIHQRRKAACRQQQNESLAIARRNLFDDDASSSVNIEPKTAPAPKSLYEHSFPNPSGFQNPIVLPKEQIGNIVNSCNIWLIQSVYEFQECTAFIRNKILQFRQEDNEPIKDTWRRLEDLFQQAPHHGIRRWLLVQLFYDNVTLKNKEKLDQFTQFRFSSLNEDEGWN